MNDMIVHERSCQDSSRCTKAISIRTFSADVETKEEKEEEEEEPQPQQQQNETPKNEIIKTTIKISNITGQPIKTFASIAVQTEDISTTTQSVQVRHIHLYSPFLAEFHF